MNKNDFYKQLMSEYAFDADKIRENARKGRFAKQKISPMAIGLTAAVAAVTVTVGTVAVSMIDDRQGVDLVGNNSALSALSPSERIQNAIEQQAKLQDSEEVQNVLVTFTQPISPSAAKAVLTAYTDENIPVKAVYLSDGSRISGSDEVAAVFGSDKMISGVYIECAGSVMAQLQQDNAVALVESMTESDLDTIVPIDPEDVETIEITIPDNSEADQPVQNVAPSVPTTSGDTSDDNPVDILPETIEAQPIFTEEPSEDIDVTEEPVELPETKEPSVTEDAPATEDAAPEAEEVPVVTEPVKPVIQQLPEGVTLPMAPDAFSYESEFINADLAYFISDDIYFVRTENNIALYEFDGSTSTLVTSVECSQPKTHWIAENGGRMLITSVGENGCRNKLWLVDSYSGDISNLNAEEIVMDGTITDIGYNADSKTVMFVIKEYGTYYTYAMTMQSGGTMSYINNVFETAGKTTLLSFNGSTVYIAVNDGAITQIHAVDINTCDSRIIKTYDSKPVISNNLAFTYGIIQPSESALTGVTEIFDPVTETFIRTEFFNESISFGVSRDHFAVNGSYYAVTGGAVTSSGGILAVAQIDYKKSLSGLYTAAADNGYVSITESAYSDRNIAGMLNFGHITSNGETEFIHAVKGAIGMNNALAMGVCGKCGIHSQAKLLECLPVYYSTSAVTDLKKLCGISDFGTLAYTDGGLTAIDAENIELVINSNNGTTASGVLYIKAGVFGGKIAYRSVNISFVLENNSWRVDSIIGK